MSKPEQYMRVVSTQEDHHKLGVSRKAKDGDREVLWTDGCVSPATTRSALIYGEPWPLKTVSLKVSEAKKVYRMHLDALERKVKAKS